MAGRFFMINILHDQLIPLIVAPYCLTIGIIIISRIKTIREKKQHIFFSLLCLFFCIHSLGTIFSKFIDVYFWITGTFLFNLSIIFSIEVTSKKLYKILLPFSIISSLYLFYDIFFMILLPYTLGTFYLSSLFFRSITLINYTFL